MLQKRSSAGVVQNEDETEESVSRESLEARKAEILEELESLEAELAAADEEGQESSEINPNQNTGGSCYVRSCHKSRSALVHALHDETTHLLPHDEHDIDGQLFAGPPINL